jgi:hypothetical protein
MIVVAAKDSDDSPPRRLRTRSKEFLIKTYSEVCELGASAVNFSSFLRPLRILR